MAARIISSKASMQQPAMTGSSRWAEIKYRPGSRGRYGNDTIYQYGGQGDSNLTAACGMGNDTIIQVGGQGSNQMNIMSGDGEDYIEQYGGSGNNFMRVNPGYR